MSDAMSRLDEIRAREKAASPGEWRVWFTNTPMFVPKPLASGGAAPGSWGPNPPPRGLWRLDGEVWEDETTLYLPSEKAFTDDDAEFIAHARADIPWLLDEIARLQRDIALLVDEPWCAEGVLRLGRNP